VDFGAEIEQKSLDILSGIEPVLSTALTGASRVF